MQFIIIIMHRFVLRSFSLYVIYQSI